MIQRWWRTSVQFRLVSFFLLLSWSSVLTVGWLAYSRARHELAAAALTNLDGAAALKGDELRRWVDAQRRDLLVLASWPDLHAVSSELLGDAADGHVESGGGTACVRMRELLAPVLDEKHDLQEVFLLTDVGGRIVCSTSGARTAGDSRALDAYYVKGRQSTFIQTVYSSPVTGRPLVTVATPLRVRGPVERAGVLAAHLNLEEMDRIVRAPSGLGPGSEIYLVDRYNVFISAARFGTDRFPRGIHSRGIDAAVMGADGSGQYANYAGTPVLGAYRWIEELGVAVLAELPEATAFAASHRLAWTIVAAGFLSAGVLAVGVLLIARRISAPLLAINRAARRVAAGDLSQHAPVVTHDEVGVLAQTFNEMTERLRVAHDELAESAQQFAKVFQSSPMAIVISTFEEGRYIDVNPQFVRLTGYPRDQVIGRTSREIGIWADPEDRIGLIEEVSRQGATHDASIRIRMRTGEVRECLASIALITLKNEACLVTMFDDVSDRVRAERALHASQERLRQAQKLEAIGRLAGGVAHDFNNLLTIIIGYCDMLQGRLATGDPNRAELEEIRRAGQQAAALTQQLLAFSRKQMLAPRILDLNAIIRDLDRMLKRLVGEHIRIATHLDRELGPVLVDQAQIEQVIVNLAVNARDAMPTGGTLTIETANVQLKESGAGADAASGPAPSGPSGAFVRLRVRDTGTGMDAETRQRVFEPFFTTKAPGKGTGLGLATIYGIVQQSHGHVEIETELGRGSTFSVFLPRAAGATEPRPVSVPVRSTVGSETILVVEDEEVVRHLLRDVLGTHGYEVLTAGDATEGLAIAERHPGPIDLVISDVVLPGISGLALIERMPQVRPRAKVMLLSGYADDAIAGHGELDPAIPFLRKPFHLHDLTRRVREILDSASPGQAHDRPARRAERAR